MPVDPITVSVVQHRLFAIVEEMGEAMLRTSYSQILNSSRDFSTALADPRGRLIAQAEHVPIHVGALPFAVRAIQEAFEGAIRPGDVFLLNDPYRGGNHLPDLTAFVPVFAEGKHLFWAINRAHQSDIGGSTHGAYNPAATEIWQEGIRVPPLRLYDGGRLREDVLELLALNVRHPRDFKGDLAAMIGSARVGARRLEALLAELGTTRALEAIEAVLDGAERRVRAILASWPDGSWYGEAVLDDDGHGRENVTIRARVSKRGSDLEVDLGDSDPECEGFVNSSLANTYSACVVALAYLVDPDIPKNDGAFRPLSVKTREGTVVHPREGRPVTLCTNHCGQEIIEAIVKALAPVCPERAMAGWGRRFRVALRGIDPRTRRPFLWHLFQARPGGGASAAGDGWPAAGEWQAAGGIKFGSLEVQEVRFPLFFLRHELRPDSGGDGEHRGGPGAILEMRVEVEEPAVANTAGDGIRHGACGILGGRDGAPHDYRLRAPDGTEQILKTKEVGIRVEPGAVLVARSGGGGGWGDPARRSARARARDRAEGYTSDGGETEP